MAVTVVTELGTERSSSTRDKNIREYVRQFRVQTDSEDDGPALVKADPSIPKLYDSYDTGFESDLLATVNSIEVRQEDENRGQMWLVNVRYSTETEGDEENEEDDPTLDPPDVSWSFAQFQEVAEKGIRVDEKSPTGDDEVVAVVNSAGEAFDPPVEKDESRPVLTITRFERSFDPSIAIEYQDAINSDPFFGFDPLQAKMAHISARIVYDRDDDGERIFYWQITYEVHFRRETWVKEILDQGHHYRELDDGSPEANKLSAFRTFLGDDVTEPRLLNGEGNWLGAPSIIKFFEGPGPEDQPYFLQYKVYEELPFAPLGLEVL